MRGDKVSKEVKFNIPPEEEKKIREAIDDMLPDEEYKVTFRLTEQGKKEYDEIKKDVLDLLTKFDGFWERLESLSEFV